MLIKKLSIRKMMEEHDWKRVVGFYACPDIEVAPGRDDILREEMQSAIRNSISGPTLFLCPIHGPAYELFALEVLHLRALGESCRLAVLSDDSRLVSAKEGPFCEIADFVVYRPRLGSASPEDCLNTLEKYSDTILCFLTESQFLRLTVLKKAERTEMKNLYPSYMDRLREPPPEPAARAWTMVRDLSSLFLSFQPMTLRLISDGTTLQKCEFREIREELLGLPVVRLGVGREEGLVVYING